MKEITLEQILENQAKIAAPKVKVQVKPQVSQVLMFDENGKRVIPGVKEEVVEKTQVTQTKAQFTKNSLTITSKTHVDQESEFLM